MGPFVPDVISDQLNLVVALFLGMGFGFVLEQAGFSSSRRLAGVFYGYDFTVLRVFFTAAVTAMSGVLLAGHLGYLDTEAIFVNPTWLLPAVVGGVIMGLGFIVGGYCPGTGVCAAAIGKVDAMFFVGGGFVGAFAFMEGFPLYADFFASTPLGPALVFDSIGVSRGAFAFGLVVVAIAAFALTTLVERRVNPVSAPSLAFKPWRHFAAGTVVLALGALIAFLPDRKAELIATVSDPIYVADHPVRMMDADELAFRIVDREPNLLIIDLRPPGAFQAASIPRSENVPVPGLFGREWVTALSPANVIKVVVADDEASGRSAGLLLQELGYGNVAVLAGGFGSFEATFIRPASLTGRSAGGAAAVDRFRESARADIARMIAQEKTGGAKVVIKKVIKGGC